MSTTFQERKLRIEAVTADTFQASIDGEALAIRLIEIEDGRKAYDIRAKKESTIDALQDYLTKKSVSIGAVMEFVNLDNPILEV